MNHLKPYVLLTLAICLHASPVAAGDIYRWVDDAGRTQLSDVVPEKYRAKAQRIDSKQFELSPAQRAEAAARAARERAALAAAGASAVRAAQPPASAPSAPRPMESAGSECERLWQAYRAAQECFAPYQRRNAGVAVEAFQKCPIVDNPSQKCGPSKW
jgi:hypothetical protein